MCLRLDLHRNGPTSCKCRNRAMHQADHGKWRALTCVIVMCITEPITVKIMALAYTQG
jgi:hypothetical protein